MTEQEQPVTEQASDVEDAANEREDEGDGDLLGLDRGYGQKTITPYTTVGGTALKIASVNYARLVIRIRNNGAATAYLGKDNTVTVANGYPLPAGAEVVDEETVDEWWVITAAAGDVRVMEVG